MIVLSDTSVLSALAELGWLDLLAQLYSEITITRSVESECRHPGSPGELRAWLTGDPAFLTIITDPAENLPEVSSLGAGEASSITYAWLHREVSFLILDDHAARSVARALGLPLTGLVGVLVKAAARGLLDFATVPSKLSKIGFRVSDAVIQDAREQLAAMQKPDQPPDSPASE